MKKKPGFFYIATWTLLAFIGTLRNVHAAKCLENKDFYQNLPAVIGKEDQVGKVPFVLKCDTTFVRRGVTTVVYPGTMLYFNDAIQSRIRKV